MKKKAIIQILGICIMAVLMTMRVYAEDVNVSVSSAEVTQGEEVRVTVTLSSNVDIAGYSINITYNADVLEYVSGADGGGGGSVSLYNDYLVQKSETRTLVFKAKAAGETSLTVQNIGGIIDINTDDLNLVDSSGSVKVNALVVASSNNNLASLGVSAVRKDGSADSVGLEPAFSKDVTEYRRWLGSQFNKLSISATPEDAKATVAVAGTDLTTGTNVTTITVTAENGDKKVYTITTYVAEEATEAPTEQPTQAEPSTGTPAEVPDNGQKKAEIGGKSYVVVDVSGDVTLPEGFEQTGIAWNGVEVMGAADLSGVLNLVYVMDEETGEYSFYIYNDSDKSYFPFLTYGITQRAYIMLMVNDDFIYNGKNAGESTELELTVLGIAGGSVDAYKVKNTENIYIVRAMNWDNKIYYYYYNSTDGSMLPYFESTAGGEEPSDGSSNTGEPSNGINSDERAAFEKSIEKRNTLIYILVVFLLLLIAAVCALVIIILKKNGKIFIKKDRESKAVPDNEISSELSFDGVQAVEEAAVAIAEEEGEAALGEAIPSEEEALPEAAVAWEKEEAFEEEESSKEPEESFEEPETLKKEESFEEPETLKKEEISEKAEDARYATEDDEEEPMDEAEFESAIDDILGKFSNRT